MFLLASIVIKRRLYVSYRSHTVCDAKESNASRLSMKKLGQKLTGDNPQTTSSGVLEMPPTVSETRQAPGQDVSRHFSTIESDSTFEPSRKLFGPFPHLTFINSDSMRGACKKNSLGGCHGVSSLSIPSFDSQR
jgi:hypothetical protein